MKTVRLKVYHRTDGTGDFDVKVINESFAQRLVEVNPKMYQVVAPPKIEITKLPPIEKKSVTPAESEVHYEVKMKTETLNAGETGTIPTTAHVSKPPLNQTTEEVIKKRGRPAKNQS